ncbi:MAG: GNAT family N-acetyltransferase [Bacteroidetes bacterium]|nr:GNAT family N-acetyltransferase [Bacteroidota bacterium]
MNLDITSTPSFIQLNEIREWLEYEDRQSNKGFFCQWNTIEPAFKKGNAFLLSDDDNKAIGFLTFYISDKIVDIGIAEVKPSERKKGIGGNLIKLCSDYFIKQGVQVVQLYCDPKSSEIFWKKIGFKSFPKGVINDSRIYLYKIIVPHLDYFNESSDDNLNEIIELWDEADHIVESCKMTPKWRWKIEREKESDKLTLPLIHPAESEWTVCFKKGNKIYEKRIMKNFDNKRHAQVNFLIINEIGKI